MPFSIKSLTVDLLFYKNIVFLVRKDVNENSRQENKGYTFLRFTRLKIQLRNLFYKGLLFVITSTDSEILKVCKKCTGTLQIKIHSFILIILNWTDSLRFCQPFCNKDPRRHSNRDTLTSLIVNLVVSFLGRSGYTLRGR